MEIIPVDIKGVKGLMDEEKTRSTNIFLIIITSTLCDDWTASCPSICKCKWSNGKKSAICNNLNLTQIPLNLSTELQVLILNGNNISHLHREEFTTLRLINLQKIHLRNTGIRWVHRESFKDLKILIEIDLSYNLIESLDKQTFTGNDRLRIVMMSGNPIKELVADQFPVLPYFRNLEMEDCKLVQIHETAFSNLDLLEYLNLKGNLLSNLPEHVFNHMKNLKTLILEDNPWNCDCTLKRFKIWYNRKGGFPSLTCHEPSALKDKKWEVIDTDDFGCPPTIEILRDEFQVEDVGLNITYKCLSHGEPLPTIIWDVNGKMIEESETVRIEEEKMENNELWSNLTLFNLSSYDAGIYTCSAQNKFGFVNKNFSLILPEIVGPILIRTPETFWYFGLIVGIFGSIFALMFISISICICKKFTNRRRRKKNNIKNSVSFNDQEKKLLDLSITTQDKQDSSEIVNTPSTAKTDSIIALEPVQITIENISRNEEFPLNVGVFPPPPEFRSNVVPTTPYGNIFISVSLTQDAINENPHVDMYPDLLNIPKRIKGAGKFVPVNVSSYATLPRPHPSQAVGRLTATSSSMHGKPVPSNSQGVALPATILPTVCVPASSGQCQPASAETTLTETVIDNYSQQSEQDQDLSTQVCLACRQKESEYHAACENTLALSLNYDNMGRRVTAGGNTILVEDTILEEPEDAQGATCLPEPPPPPIQQNKLSTFGKELPISTLPLPPPPPQLMGTSPNNDFVSL
uniref:CSON012429 protein n=1 Tax=Culicoides sonorensis TaxID=179676 RepID=A0A336M660_CULSO